MRASCMRIIWGLQQNQLFCAHLTSSGRRQWHPTPSTLAWKIPWAEEPGGLQSRGLWRVRHDWVASLSLFTFTHWRRKWQPTPVFLPGESQGQGSLVGCPLWGRRVGHNWSDLAVAAAVKHMKILRIFMKQKYYHAYFTDKTVGEIQNVPSFLQ